MLQHGMWDQVRVDHGKEWTLLLFVQELLAHLRTNTNRAPHLQTTSKQVNNNIIIITLKRNVIMLTSLRIIVWSVYGSKLMAESTTHSRAAL